MVVVVTKTGYLLAAKQDAPPLLVQAAAADLDQNMYNLASGASSIVGYQPMAMTDAHTQQYQKHMGWTLSVMPNAQLHLIGALFASKQHCPSFASTFVYMHCPPFDSCQGKQENSSLVQAATSVSHKM